MSKKKKIVLLVAMVLVLAIAAYVNIALLTQGNDDKKEPVTATGNFFVTARADRQTTRGYEITQLNDILKIEGEEYAQARADAMKQKQRLIEITETEQYLETMLKAQGFADAVVSIGASSNNVSVIVSSDELTREDTAKIYSVIMNELKTTTDYINILAI